MAHFYCAKLTGLGFSIKDWNEALKYCNDFNIQGVERDKILNPEKYPCKEQYFTCMAEVGKRRIETKKL